MKLPSIRGTGKLPRYGGGWMHQFGHVYLLQQELLEKPFPATAAAEGQSDWFRAMELWHTGRQEGLAMNVSHYTTILQHCAAPDSGAPWTAALGVLRQMRRDALRADCTVVSLALQCCARDAHADSALDVFSYFADLQEQRNETGKYAGAGLKLDSVCVAAVLQACVGAGQQEKALQFVKNISDKKSRSATRGVSSISIETALHDLALVNDVPADVSEPAIQSLSSEKAPQLLAEPKSDAGEPEPELVPVLAKTEFVEFYRRLSL